MGELLRQWRERLWLSQLELALRAEVSTRHLSVVETGRSAPSRSMVLHLAEQPTCRCVTGTKVLLAAGYVPIDPEATLADQTMAAVRAALRQVLAGHEPYSALVDGAWTLLDANPSVALLTSSAAPALLRPPVNVLRLSLPPRTWRPASPTQASGAIGKYSTLSRCDGRLPERRSWADRALGTRCDPTRWFAARRSELEQCG